MTANVTSSSHPIPSTLEIEKKYLLDHKPKDLGKGYKIIQSYIFIDPQKEMRVRVQHNKGIITVKFKLNIQIREEFEYVIPRIEALRMLKLASVHPPIEKIRHKIKYKNKIWVVDVFEGNNQGLMLAEVELSCQNEEIFKPAWIGREVTNDDRYYNAKLFLRPYKHWDRISDYNE